MDSLRFLIEQVPTVPRILFQDYARAAEAQSGGVASAKNYLTTQAPLRRSQVPKCPMLELPETSHAAVAAVAKIVVDSEPPGGKTPNNDRIVIIYQLLAPRPGQWIIYI